MYYNFNLLALNAALEYNINLDCTHVNSIQYTMLCGNAPFYGQSLSTEEIMERIRAGQFSFDAPEWARVSRAAKSIIEGTSV